MTTLDGLSALQAKRQRATQSARHVPPPRKAPRVDSAETPVVQETVTEKVGQAGRPETVEGPSAPGARVANQETPSQGSAAELVKPLLRSTIYLTEDDDVWLEQISSRGRLRRPRVDASRSAVTRLALERLREDLSPEEVVGLLAGRSDNSTQTVGRKRL